jgi:IPT/TIG domain
VDHSKLPLRRSFRRQLLRAGLGVLLGACASGDRELSSRRAGAPEESDPPLGFVEDPTDPAALGPRGELAPLDPNGLFGVDPAHGPFRGGQLALIRGNGFSSRVRVWFGDVEVPPEQLTPTRSDRVQVTVPAGTPGSVALTTQLGDDASTRRVLDQAYRYDAFYAEPDSGLMSGGSVITLHGLGTGWDATTSVNIDQQPCEVVEVRGAAGGAQELDCRAPASTEGRKSISVATGDAIDTVLGGFLYEPGTVSLGGLSGEPLAGRLNVHVTASGGAPIADAYVILGSDIDLATLGQPGSSLQQTDAAGDAVFEGDAVTPDAVTPDAVTPDGVGAPLVTVAAHCFHPQSIVKVPVDTVHIELDRVSTPDCGQTPPAFFGGSPTAPVVIRGELVWQGGVEFQRAGWTNVPQAQNANERRAAYIFQPSGDPESGFRLPRESDAITPDSAGRTGYDFELVTGAGSRTLYAIAGVENRAESPPRFTAYAMGLLRGIYASPGDTVEGLAIVMNRTVDQALSFDVVGPVPGARGPDRIAVHAAVKVAGAGYAILPNVELTTPVAGGSGLSIIGLPALVGELQGSRYVLGARASTGVTRSAPSSVISLISAPESSQRISVSGFLPVPTLTVGASDAPFWGGELAVAFDDAAGAVSLVSYDIRSGGGLVSWSVVAPPTATSFRLPDLSRLPEGGLLEGTLDVSVSLASVADFEYAALTTEQLSRFSWLAYATDVARARFEPSVP